MRAIFIAIILLLGFFILYSGVKTVKKSMETRAAAIEEIMKDFKK